MVRGRSTTVEILSSMLEERRRLERLSAMVEIRFVVGKMQSFVVSLVDDRNFEIMKIATVKLMATLAQKILLSACSYQLQKIKYDEILLWWE